MAQQRDKIKLVSNVPLVIEYEPGEQGKECTSNFHDGIEYRYFVVQNGQPSILYLPLDGHRAIQRLAPRAGDEVEIVKQAEGRSISYSARFVQGRLPDQQTPQPTQPTRLLAPQPRYAAPPQQGPAQQTFPKRTSEDITYTVPEEIAPRRPETGPHSANYQYGAAAQAQQPEPEEPAPSLVQAMAGCIVLAHRAYHKAALVLHAEGTPMPEPRSEDLRAVAISMFIERSRQNGGR